MGVVAGAPAALGADSGFELHPYVTAGAARHAVGDRDIYGAVADGVTYVATGASPAVAANLRVAVPGNRVVDLAPGTRHDRRAATVGGLPLPLSILGIFVGALATLTTRRIRDRLLALLGGAVLAGALTALIDKTWLEAVPGHWLALAGASALTVGAVGSVVAGLATKLGPPGIGVGGVLMMILGNAWSGASSAPELLPEPAHTIGQLFPAGAAGELLRSVGWFGGADAAWHVAVLAAWGIAGLMLVTVPVRRPSRARVARATAVGA